MSRRSPPKRNPPPAADAFAIEGVPALTPADEALADRGLLLLVEHEIADRAARQRTA